MLKAVNGMMLDMLAAIAEKITKTVDVDSQRVSVRRKQKENTGQGG
jgi:hypothetical protein